MKDTITIVELLNNYLSYGLANTENVRDKILYTHSFVCESNNQVVGFVSMKAANENEFLFRNEQYRELNIAPTDLIITHLVVDEHLRNKGIGYKLLAKMLEEVLDGTNIFAVGWKKNNVKWDAESLFVRQGFEKLMDLPLYFNNVNATCPYCEKGCLCDAVLVKLKK